MKHLWYAMTAGLFCVSASAGEAKPPDLHALLKVVVAPQTQVVWDVGNQALGDDGSVVAAKLKPADWAKLTDQGGRLDQVCEQCHQQFWYPNSAQR